MKLTKNQTALTRGLAGPFFIALWGACLAAHAGSLTVRDPDGVEWNVVENPAEGRDDYLLKRNGKDHKPDDGFGRSGVTEFSLGPDNDTPTMVRVEASRRIWMSGNSAAGSQPLPVIMRFNADGSPDTHWGVQGRLGITPAGEPTRAVDVLPLTDGSVLVAGEAPRMGAPRAIVFKLKPDGTLDPSFGDGGVWHRPGPDAAAAVSLAVGGDGTVSVAVSVRGAKPMGEIWSLADKPPVLVDQAELDDNIDEDELHIEWSAGHWAWIKTTSVGHLLEAASMTKAPAASAPSDPGQGAFNPFAGGPSSSNANGNAAPTEADDSLPWGWLGLIGVLVAGVVAVFLMRGKGR